MGLSTVLDLARKELGFDSLKQFHSYLAERGLTINYQHFAKINKRQQRATPELVTQLALTLPDQADEIILSYCQELFPKQGHLFASEKANKPNDTAADAPVLKKSGTPVLTRAQIECLGRRKENYFLFIIGTLSRRVMSETELASWFDKKPLAEALNELLKHKILIKREDAYQTFSSEIRFPEKDQHLGKLYNQLDQWDLEFSKEMKFEPLLTKRFIRRISPRYMGLLLNHFTLLFDTVKASDEIDKRHNTEVIQLAVSLSKGKLPG